jgi:hypothetical protein
MLKRWIPDVVARAINGPILAVEVTDRGRWAALVPISSFFSFFTL